MAMFPRRLPMHGSRLFTILCALITIFVPRGTAQISSMSPQGGRGVRAAASPGATAMVQLTVALPPGPPLPREEMPPDAPHVSFDGKQLTIMADNATLSDILAAVRACMGADIDIPASASHERMAARLGPGPAREVLSSLLGWTDFNYIIQASDTDSEGIQTVVLTRRQNATAVGATGNPGSYAAQQSRSTRRGVAEPNFPIPEAAEPEESPVPTAPATAEIQSAPVVQPGPAQPGLAQPAEVAPSGPAQPGSADQQSAAAGQQPPPADMPAAAAALQAMPDSQTAPGAPDSNSNQTRDGMIQDLQRMYQQRLQMQQGQKAPPSS